ncbi:MAG: DinB family protein [Planctomycetes bacterium]|nr:DinB family protein [Planctomycetota bacterium]
MPTSKRKTKKKTTKPTSTTRTKPRTPKSPSPRSSPSSPSDRSHLHFFRAMASGQGFATFAMLKSCIELCPDEHWEGLIGKYPFWHVAYHTLCFADLYTAPSNKAWKPSTTFHPAGKAELAEEYPSRRFTRAELLDYLEYCRAAFRAALDAETPQSLAGPSGFSWVKIPRYELYPYNTRHVQHHVGQLSAFLRRLGLGPKWVFSADS